MPDDCTSMFKTPTGLLQPESLIVIRPFFRCSQDVSKPAVLIYDDLRKVRELVPEIQVRFRSCCQAGELKIPSVSGVSKAGQ